MDAVQVRLIWDEEMAEAVRPVGIEGAVVSGVAVTVTVADCVAVPPLPVQARV